MNGNAILTYLSELEAHNDRDWYHAHKTEREEANREFEALVGGLMAGLRRTDDSLPLAQPKELIFKLTRDTRFSHDKSPYNPSFRAHMGPKGKLPIPVGYYILLQPGGRSFLGGGLFADMFKDATAMVRGYIASHGGEWGKMITAPDFAQRFTVGGTALKKVPRGYDPDHPQAEYLKNKSWYLEFPIPDEQIIEPGFVDYAVGIFSKMDQFNRFLNKALEGFVMPAR